MTRLKFRGLGQADRYLNICCRILKQHISRTEGRSVGWQSIQNEFCKAFGYHNHHELIHDLTVVKHPDDWNHSRDTLEEVFERGFDVALELASGRGFLGDSSSRALAAQATDEVLRGNQKFMVNAEANIATDCSDPKTHD